MRPALLSELFGGEGRARLLEALFTSPGSSFSSVELARMARIDAGNASRWLARWGALGLVQRHEDGRNIRFQAGAEPLLASLSELFTRNSAVSQEILAALPASARTVAIFGSTASAEERADSDIDVLVLGDDLSQIEVNAALRPVGRKHSRDINATVFSQSEFNELLQQENGFALTLMAQKPIVLKGALPHDHQEAQTDRTR
ncbi:MAG: hypothetical protein JWQ11_927 [Rhizobacter sp.]|nr:hypothetical protein [Rhizobacter sp.]